MVGKRFVVVSEGELRLLRRMAEAGISSGTIEEIAEKTGLPVSSVASLIELLRSKDLADVAEEVQEKLELTEKGREALKHGLPEENFVKALVEGETSVSELSRKVPGTKVAVGILRRKGYLEIDKGKAKLKVPVERVLAEVSNLRNVLESVDRGEVPRDKDSLAEALRRGLVHRVRLSRRVVKLTDKLEDILGRVRVEVGALTSDHLRSGEWRYLSLRRYDISAPPGKPRMARRHPLMEFIDMLRDIMKELGFTEASGPMVEMELYNFDLLFQPQDHPAREIHDTLAVKRPSRGSLKGLEDLVSRVSEVHGRGWRYRWSPEKAARLVLRSQTTSVSARVIASQPRPPLRVFTIGRVFRSDVVDATHLPEFHQLDGIMGDYDVTFRDLLGLLSEIAGRLGMRIKFKPGYFPFTEPSVEGYVRLPNGKWLELFGAGMFRPEVLEMAGIDYPVAAWGFGIERLAQNYYGLPDIRMLYSRDVDFVSGMRVRW